MSNNQPISQNVNLAQITAKLKELSLKKGHKSLSGADPKGIHKPQIKVLPRHIDWNSLALAAKGDYQTRVER